MNWTQTTLGQVVDLFDHRRIPLNSHQRAAKQGPFPYYGAQGIIDSIDEWIFEGRYILVPEDGENLSSRKLPIAFFADGRFWVNNHAHVLRGKPGVADDVFLKHWLNQADIRPYITGAAQPKLSQESLRRIAISLPDLHYQQRVGSVLGAYDDLIEVNRRRIALLEEMARRLFREWFVRLRYPGHESVPVYDTVDGPMPDGWASGCLGNLVQLSYGRALKAEQRSPGPVPVIGSSGLVGWHTSALVRGPGIVVGRKGNVGSVIWCKTDFYPIDTTFYVKSAHPTRYVLHHLRTLHFISGDAAVPGLNREGALRTPVLIPSADLMAQFDDKVTPMMDACDVLMEANTRLTTARDLLLPRLLSGQLSVATAERALEDAA